MIIRNWIISVVGSWEQREESAEVDIFNITKTKLRSLDHVKCHVFQTYSIWTYLFLQHHMPVSWKTVEAKNAALLSYADRSIQQLYLNNNVFCLLLRIFKIYWWLKEVWLTSMVCWNCKNILLRSMHCQHAEFEGVQLHKTIQFFSVFVTCNTRLQLFSLMLARQWLLHPSTPNRRQPQKSLFF